MEINGNYRFQISQKLNYSKLENVTFRKLGGILSFFPVLVSGFLEKDVYSCYRRGNLIIKRTRYKRSTKSINSVVIALVNSQVYAFEVDFFTVDKESVFFH